MGSKVNYLAGYLSWVMDSYDLGAVVITTSILGKLFFPTLGVLGAVLPIVFTVVSRPLGSFVFGYLADLKGRKFAMLVTVLGYSLSIGLTGLLPTYYEIGILASISLALLRFVQGVFIGGDVSSSFTLSMESAKTRRGLLAGVLQGGTLVGFVLVDALFTYLASTTNIMETWRYIYFIGTIPAALAIMIRLNVTEPEVYLREGKQGKVLSGLKPLYQTIIVMIGFWTAVYAGPQFMTVFLGKYLGLPANEYGTLLTLMNAVGIVAMVVSGLISDLLGRRTVALIGSALAIVGAYLVYFLVLPINLAVLLFGFLVNLPSAITPAYLAERFKTFSRATGVGFSYNGAFIVAGFSPVFISLVNSLVKSLPVAAFTVFAVGSAVAILGLLMGPETLKASELKV